MIEKMCFFIKLMMNTIYLGHYLLIWNQELLIIFKHHNFQLSSIQKIYLFQKMEVEQEIIGHVVILKVKNIKRNLWK